MGKFTNRDFKFVLNNLTNDKIECKGITKDRTKMYFYSGDYAVLIFDGLYICSYIKEVKEVGGVKNYKVFTSKKKALLYIAYVMMM